MGCSSCGGPKYRPKGGIGIKQPVAPAVTPKPAKKRLRPIFRNGRFVVNPPVEDKPDEE